jgi:RNA-directed DNA polymerase
MIQWEQFEERFTFEARAAIKRRRFDRGYIPRCLAYARRLHDRGMPIVFDAEHFARLVGYSTSYLYGAANSASHYYREFSIPKARGGTRQIREPLPSLKEIQRWILDNILCRIPVHRFAKGFVPNHSLRDNARFHVRQPAVLKLDIENFFGSIAYVDVYGVFRRSGYSRQLSVLLAKLCTLDGTLPQGAPTSPALSNLVVYNLDHRLSSFTRKRGLRYTRYADDLTISGKLDAGEVVSLVSKILSDLKLALNPSKTRLMLRHERQIVTGVVVNDGLRAPREMRRTLRQVGHYVERFGLEGHLGRTGETRANYAKHILGVAGFVLFLNPNDRDARRAINLLSTSWSPRAE